MKALGDPQEWNPPNGRKARRKKEYLVARTKELSPMERALKLSDDLRRAEIEVERQWNDDYFQRMMKAIESGLGDKPWDLVAYGVGHFERAQVPRQQLAVCEMIVRKAARTPRTKTIYDPMFNGPERSALRARGYIVLDQNEEGKRAVQCVPTLFFMPHCARRLYNNVLRANWSAERLSYVVIVGNSFGAYAEQVFARRAEAIAPLLSRSAPVLNEIRLGECPALPRAFRDQAIMTFAQGSPSLSLWDSVPDEDVRPGEDTDIILASTDVGVLKSIHGYDEPDPGSDDESAQIALRSSTS